MKTIIYYGIIIFVIAQIFYWFSRNDEINAQYWQKRQSDCRSLGANWDLNNQGKCVAFEIQ